MSPSSVLAVLSDRLPPVRVDPSGRLSLAADTDRTPTSAERTLWQFKGRLPSGADVGLPALATAVVPVRTNAARFEDTQTPLVARSFGRPLEKLSWCPQSGEILFVHPPQQHMTARGSRPFDDYVRLIVLREWNLVCARPCWPSWVRVDGNHRPDAAALRISTVLQLQAWRVLVCPQAPPERWHFELNVNNARLQALTGRTGW